MKTISGRAKAPMIIVVGLAVAVAACVYAQQTTTTQQSSSTSQSKDGHAVATGSAHATATATSSSRSGGGVSGVQRAGQGVLEDPRPFYAVWYTIGTNNRQQAADGVKAHDDYVVGLMKQGMVFMEGPFSDETGSLLILKANDDKQAAEAVAADPAVRSGRLVPTLKHWNPRQGRFASSTHTTDRGVAIGMPIGK